jgi:polysaccharide transporter, PST family
MQQVAADLAKPGFQQAATNLAWLIGERVVRLVLGVVVGFVVARHLGPTQLGSLSYCMAVITLITGVVSLGLDAIVRRDILSAPGQEITILASSAVMRLVAGSVGYALLLGFGATGLIGTQQERGLLAIVGVMLFQPGLVVPDLWLQAHLRAKYSVIVQTISLAIGAVLRLWFVLSGAALVWFAVALVVEALVAVVGLRVAARSAGLRFSWAAARATEMRGLLRQSWPLILAGLAVVVYMKIDEVMLRLMIGPAAVGLYSAATRLTEIWYFVPTAMASSLLPALLRARERGPETYQDRLQRFYDLNASVAYLLSIPMALAAPWIVRLAYGESFAGSASIVAVHIWSSVFVFIGVARGQWLVNERLQKFYLVSTAAGAAINIGLNFIFIPRWGGLGAAIATVISQAAATWLSSFCCDITRDAGWMQTRALFVPILGWRYFARS